MEQIQNRKASSFPGLLFFVIFSFIFFGSAYFAYQNYVETNLVIVYVCVAINALILFLAKGFVTNLPNDSIVFTLFGKYVGNIVENGFFWVNPFFAGTAISLKQNNLVTPILKVNDKAGNPIEVSAVISWSVDSPSAAVLSVEDHEEFLKIQSESALRHVVGTYPYSSTTGISLQGSGDEVSRDIESQTQHETSIAGIKIHSARISHLAYAPEIAQAMLRRQQSEAIIESRRLIVDGAIGIVSDTLKKMESNEMNFLKDEDKSSLVSNLLVVLVSENGTQATISVGK